MSDEEFDEESFRAYENDLYGEKSSDSEEEIDSEIEEALYSQVHYSFSLPNEEDLDDKDGGADSCHAGSEASFLDFKQQDDKEVQDVVNEDEDSVKTIDYIVIDEESGSSSGKSNDDNDNQEGNCDDDDYHNVEVTGSTQENWSLIKEDLKTNLLADGKRRPVSRYYKKEGNFRCHNCNEKGHKATDCPTPKKISCFLCGGEHIRRRCPNELCFNCQEPGHRVMNCKQPRSRPDDQCRRCYMFGHHSKDCPDRWRQYHRTIDSKKLPVVNRTGEFNGPVYCYNCSEEGHYGHECIHDRMDNYLNPIYPFVVKYDGGPEDHQDNRISQDKCRKRTKTHDGTVGNFREEISERSKKRRGNKERRSWPKQSHDRKESRRIEEIEEGIDYSGVTTIRDGRGGEFIERISERTKKRRQRGKDKRHSWSGQRHDQEQNSRTQGIEEDMTIRIQSSIPHHQEGSTPRHFENANKVKIGSKRRHSGTPTQYDNESKKGKQAEHKINKQKRKKRKEKDTQFTSHNERIVELVHDDEVYGNEYQTSHQKKTKSKFNKQKEPLPDAFTRMVEDWEEMNTSQHSSPAYSRPQSQGSSRRQNKKFKEDKRSSQEYNRKPYNSSRGFRSKWK